MAWFELFVDVDARGMEPTIAANVAESLGLLPAQSLVRITADEPSLAQHFAAWLLARDHLVWLETPACDLARFGDALARVTVVGVRGALGDVARRALTEAYARGAVIVVDAADHDLGAPAFTRQDGCYWAPDPEYVVNRDGVWRTKEGASLDSLQHGLATRSTWGPSGRLPMPVELPGVGGMRRSYWSGGSQALGFTYAQCEGFAALGFDCSDAADDEALRLWIDGVVPNRKRVDVKFDRFPVVGLEQVSWAQTTPTAKEQNAIIAAAAWMLSGHMDVLLEALGLFPGGEVECGSQGKLAKVAEFVIASIVVAARSRAPKDRRRRVAAALLRFGSPDAARAMSRLRDAQPDVAESLIGSEFEGRASRWKKRSRAYLLDALRVACGHDDRTCGPSSS